YPDRVIYGSENGASMEAWLAVRDNDAMSAQFIWTGIDFLGEAKGWPIRASQAGFMDLAGFKKPNYFHRQSLWSTKPMAFLSVVRPEDVKSNHNPRWYASPHWNRSEEHTSELQSRENLVCRLLLEKIKEG